MKDDKLDKIIILAKLCAICDLEVKLQEDKDKLKAELKQLEKDEREDNNTQA
tara:strand:+ start:1062 stop:1217 length:156 start_codon:yes stop_codon:yes gene_type:complete